MDVETGETQTEIAREEVLHLSISTAAFWEGTAVGEALEKNCEKLEEWSEGTIDICIYDGGVMGSDSELIPGVQQGTTVNCEFCLSRTGFRGSGGGTVKYSLYF